MNEPMMMLTRDRDGTARRRFAAPQEATVAETQIRPLGPGRLGRLWSQPQPEPSR